ncbi:hypothetical protein [Actinacidiphila acididurans]|uniref:Uncharacterized protein n=1 Tax=Actinacidiphila acididurans TaxID=2784346 RepID=A0ABS2U714_9ACTN|nr:hypothetical protein [Actinacidiphila acididurans]MBM9509948.1 hypothetical protein [Actinacidiphila acididurans]
MTEQEPPLPVFVTFETGARLLIDLDIDPEATATAIRYVARTAADWPFGDGRPHRYVKVSNARTMETGVFLDYFRKHPRSGRGPDKQQRRRRGEAP